MADNTQINDFFDLAAFAEQAQIIVNESAKTAKLMREQFAEVGKGLNVDGLSQYAAAAEKLQKTQRSAKQVLSDYEKAQEKLTKSQGDYNRDLERLDELLQAEAKSTAAMAAQNKALEQIRKNLNTTDKDYAATVQKIIDKQNANIKVMKEFQNVEQKRTSGIGKYKEAIEAALNTTGGYRAQLMNIRNTMAEIEQAIMAAKEAHGAESAEVRTLQEEYAKLQARAGKLQDAQNDMQARIKYLADDYGKFKAVLQGMQAAMGIVSVFQGATAVLGIHSEAVEKTTKNMAALIAMMQGMKQVQELLNKDNYFRQFINQSPAVAGAINKILRLLKSMGGYLGVLTGIVVGFTKTLKALRSNEFYEFNKTLEKTKDASERLALSQEFLQKQFGTTTLTVGNLNEHLAGTAKGFNDIVKAIAETALADAMSTKLKELADKAVQLAAYEAQANKKLDELAKKEKQMREESGAAFVSDVSSPMMGDQESAMLGVAQRSIARGRDIQKVVDEQKAITTALEEQRKEFEKYASDYQELANTSAEELAGTLGTILEGVDLAGLLAKGTDNVATGATNAAQAVGALATATAAVNEETVKLANSSQLAALERMQRYTQEVGFLQVQLRAGRMTMEEFEKRLAELTFEKQRADLEAAIADLEKLNETLDSNSEEYVRNAMEVAKLKKQLNDLDFRKFAEGLKNGADTATAEIEKVEDRIRRLIDTIGDAAGEIIGGIESASEAAYSAQMQRLQGEEAAMALHYEMQRAYIEANVQDEEERQQKLAQLALDEANAKAAAARKEAEVARKKAKVDLAITAAKASADVAAAIAAAVLTAAAGGEAYTVAVRIAAAVAAVVAAGAAVASAASKVGTIPAFEKGGEAKRGLIFRAGERGYEVGEGVSGRSYLFPQDGVYVAPEQMRIHPHGESVQMVNNYNKAVTLRNSLTVKVIDNKRIEKYFGV